MSVNLDVLRPSTIELDENIHAANARFSTSMNERRSQIQHHCTAARYSTKKTTPGAKLMTHGETEVVSSGV
jgi:hypothetical protein